MQDSQGDLGQSRKEVMLDLKIFLGGYVYLFVGDSIRFKYQL